MRVKGNEFGSTTGRERRCGWLDMVSLKYSIMINGVTQLTMMKSDVLDGFDTIKICTRYKLDGKEIDYVPYEMTEDIKPVYTEFKGWKTDMTSMSNENEFPEAFKAYVDFIEKATGVAITVVSVGPNRSQTIERK